MPLELTVIMAVEKPEKPIEMSPLCLTKSAKLLFNGTLLALLDYPFELWLGKTHGCWRNVALPAWFVPKHSTARDSEQCISPVNGGRIVGVKRGYVVPHEVLERRSVFTIWRTIEVELFYLANEAVIHSIWP